MAPAPPSPRRHVNSGSWRVTKATDGGTQSARPSDVGTTVGSELYAETLGNDRVEPALNRAARRKAKALARRG